MKASFLSRTFTPLPDELLPAVTMTVTRYDWTATGGPKTAQIVANGTEAELLRLIALIGSPIYIYSPTGRWEWGGLFTALDLSGHGMNVSFDLADLANSVAVLYTYQGDGQTTAGAATKTAYSTTTASTAIYGTKQLLVSGNNLTSAEATSLRDVTLAQRNLPRARWRAGGNPGTFTATLSCTGLYDTLAWKYYSATVSGDVYAPESLLVSDKNRLGDATGNAALAQSFAVTCGHNYYIPAVRIHLQKVYDGGYPSDSVKVSIQGDNAGEPDGMVIDSGTLAVANIDTKLQWHEFTLTGTTAYTDTSTYWIVAERTPAQVPGGDSYYFVGTDEEAGYAGGECLLYDSVGAVWQPRSPAADMPFQVIVAWDSITQIQDIAGTSACGQFLSGTVDALTAASSVPSPPYRDGNRTGLDLISEMLRAGVSGGRELLAWVDGQRVLRIEQEEAVPSKALVRIQSDGRLTTKWQEEQLLPRQIIRQWAALEDARALEDYSAYVYGEGTQLVTRAAWTGGETRVTEVRAPAITAASQQENLSAQAADLAPFIVALTQNAAQGSGSVGGDASGNYLDVGGNMEGAETIGGTADGYDFTLVRNSVEFLTLSSTELVINDASNDQDTRIESNGDTHMFFVDAGNDKAGISTSSPGIIFDVNNLSGFTDEGGHAVRVVAGEALARGEVVQITQAGGADGKVYKNAIDSDMPVGVVYAAANANDPVWIVTSGIAYVLPNAADTATRGYIIYSSSTTAGRVDQATAVPAITQHVREVGHWLDTGSGAGALTRAIIHWN